MMKLNGIINRVDDLGRIVIPKEIRRTLRIKEGDPLEIFTDKEGNVVLKKYSVVKEFVFRFDNLEHLETFAGETEEDCEQQALNFFLNEMEDKNYFFEEKEGE